ncbi:MAG: helix-turn-helix transcriptional regulator [Cyanobacteria bacterium J06634_6]
MNDAERSYHRELGTSLKDARKSANLTQQQLANAMGIQRTSITNKEKGNQAISVWDLVTICRICKADISEMLPKVDVPVTDNLEAMASMSLTDRVELY